MSARLDELAARKALLLARLRLERLQVSLYAGQLRDAVRPAGLIGGAIAKPAAAVALVEAIAPLFGLQRLARWVRLGRSRSRCSASHASGAAPTDEAGSRAVAMRLVGVMMVRNAADIIEACLRHNLAFLDGIAIVDHGSTDGTSDILAALLREGLPVFIGNEDEPAFNPPTVVNRLVRHVFATSDANWVFPLDCDEFLKTPSRAHLEDTLRAVPPQRHLQLDWLTYVPQFDVGDDMHQIAPLRATSRNRAPRRFQDGCRTPLPERRNPADPERQSRDSARDRTGALGPLRQMRSR